MRYTTAGINKVWNIFFAYNKKELFFGCDAGGKVWKYGKREWFHTIIVWFKVKKSN